MKTINIIRWIGVVFFALMAIYTITQGGILGALLIILGGIIILPINIIKSIRNKLKLNKVITIILSVVLLFAGVLTTPAAKETSEKPNDTQTSSQALLESPTSSNESATNSTTSDDTLSSSPQEPEQNQPSSDVGTGKNDPVNLSNIPAYSGKAYVTINDNIPNFSADELKTTGYETYSNLDQLGRTQTAIASVGKDTMPKENEKRGSISSITPSGWKQATYDNISGKYLYNRCHLIGWQLSAENANPKNLITGTKYLNIDGMLPFENMVADYIKETGNHVAYRITPIYQGNNLLASGVQMEAYSVEDNGEGICFNVYCYNVQPDITINYADGSSSASSSQTPVPAPTPEPTPTPTPDTSSITYVLNTNTKKFHYPSCSSAKKITENNYAETSETRDQVVAKGYDPCGNCKP